MGCVYDNRWYMSQNIVPRWGVCVLEGVFRVNPVSCCGGSWVPIRSVIGELREREKKK